MGDFKDVTLLFDDDAEGWAESFFSNFQTIGVECCMYNIKTLLPIPTIIPSNQLKASKAILVILSEQLLDFLVKNKGLHLRDCVADPRKGILFFLNVSLSDITDNHLEDRFTEYNSEDWTKRCYDENCNAEDFQECLNTFHDVVRSNTEECDELHATDDFDESTGETPMNNERSLDVSSEPEHKPAVIGGKGYMCMNKTPKPVVFQEEYSETDNVERNLIQEAYGDVTDSYSIKKPKAKTRKVAKAQLVVTVVPSVVQCEMESEVALCFKEPLTGYQAGSMDLELVDASNRYSKFAVKEVEQLNPYTYKFKLTGHLTEQKINLNVYWKDECVASCPFELRSYTPIIDGIGNILLEVLDEACGVLQKADTEGLQKLDNQLKESFLNSQTTIRPDAFENIFGMYSFLDCDVSSKEELPTLIHLSAKYGLKELSGKLMDLPSACKACSITNKEHKQPAELAEKYGHKDLEVFFRDISDMGEDTYNLYMQMNNYEHGYLKAKQGSGYYNKSATNLDPAMALYYMCNKVTTLPKSPHSAPSDQIVYDETEFPPTEDYMDMNKISRTLNLPPKARNKGGSPAPVAKPHLPAPTPPPSSDGQEIYDDPDQEPQNPRFTFSITAAEKEAAAKGSPMSPVMSPEQEELVLIQKRVAEEELTIDEARSMYYEWQRQNENKPHDFRTRSEHMKKMQDLKQQMEKKKNGNKKSKPVISNKPKTQDKKGKKAMFTTSDTKVYVRADAVQRPPPTLAKPAMKPPPEEVYDDVDSDTEEKKPIIPYKNFRNSSGSNGSRDSAGDSGVGGDPEEDKAPKRPGPRKTHNKAGRKSFTEIPQLPPKLPAKGTHLNRGYGKPPPETPLSPSHPGRGPFYKK